MEQSYGQAKIAKAHIESQQRQSKNRQKSVKERIKKLQVEARQVWLELRQMRREIVAQNSIQDNEEQVNEGNGRGTLTTDTDSLPPYKRNLLSSSAVVLDQPSSSRGVVDDTVTLPRAFRRRVDRESISRSKEIVRQVAIEVGGWIEDDNVEDDEFIREEEDLPGFELSFR